jgi:hypothetical protein
LAGRGVNGGVFLEGSALVRQGNLSKIFFLPLSSATFKSFHLKIIFMPHLEGWAEGTNPKPWGYPKHVRLLLVAIGGLIKQWSGEPILGAVL